MILVKEKKQIVILIVAATMVAAFLLCRYLPLHTRKRAALRQINEQLAVIAKGEADRRILPGLTEQFAHETNDIANYDAKVPPQRQLGEFLKAANAIMNELKLEEPLIQPGRQTQAGELNVVPLDIRCKGTLDQLFRFYTACQRMPRMIRIEEVSLQNDRNYEGMVTMNTKAAIYYGGPQTDVKVASVD